MTSTNQTSDIKIDPECQSDNKEFAYSATGWILPCCYADNHNIEDFHSITSAAHHLKVDNVEAIEDIFVSDEWTTFMKKLHDDPNSAPRACQFYCGQKWKTKDVTVI